MTDGQNDDDDINSQMQLKNPHVSAAPPVKVGGRYRAQTSEELRGVLTDKLRDERLAHGREVRNELIGKVFKAALVLGALGAAAVYFYDDLVPYSKTWGGQVGAFFGVFGIIFALLIYVRH